MRRIDVVLVFLLLSTLACQKQAHKKTELSTVSDEIDSIRHTLIADSNLVFDYDPITDDSLVLAVIEIPAGTNSKWEVAKDGRSIEWERQSGSYRVVEFLAYPFNYGMVPQTSMPISSGGDGDPLDIAVLGPSQSRGAVIPVRLIGILRLRDGGEVDDKLIAIDTSGPLASIRSFEQMDTTLIGISDIIELWFTNYKGSGKMESGGFEGVDSAWKTLAVAIEMFDGTDGDQK